MISHGYACPLSDDYPRVRSPQPPQSRSNSDDALTNSTSSTTPQQPSLKTQTPQTPLSPLAPTEFNDKHTEAENSLIEEQLQHLKKNNNGKMYLNGNGHISNASITITPVNLVNNHHPYNFP